MTKPSTRVFLDIGYRTIQCYRLRTLVLTIHRADAEAELQLELLERKDQAALGIVHLLRAPVDVSGETATPARDAFVRSLIEDGKLPALLKPQLSSMRRVPDDAWEVLRTLDREPELVQELAHRWCLRLLDEQEREVPLPVGYDPLTHVAAAPPFYVIDTVLQALAAHGWRSEGAVRLTDTNGWAHKAPLPFRYVITRGTESP